MKQIFRHIKQTFSQEHLDKTISGGIKDQIKLLIELVLIVFIVIVLIVSLLDVGLGCNENLGEKIWVIYNNFIDAGNQSSQEGWVNRIIVSIIGLLGSILLGGILISTISNIIERRVERIKSGKVYYKSINHHYVIIGYNYVVFSLIKELHKEDREAKIIVMSDVDSESIRQHMQTQLTYEEEKIVYVYCGNIDSVDDLKKLNINTAKEIYILGKEKDYGRDSKIIQIVRHINWLKVTTQKTGQEYKDYELPVYALFEKIGYYNVIQRLDILKSIQDNSIANVPCSIYFRPFNLYENWARRLWSLYSLDNDNQKVSTTYDSLDYDPICFLPDGSLKNNDKYIHLTIIGFGGMGQALLLEALRVCHYANYDDTKESTLRIRTKITIIDNKMEILKEYFITAFPNLDTQIDDIEIDYQNKDGNHWSTQQELLQWAKDSQQMLTIAICLSDPDECVRFGLSLPTEIYQTETRILIRQDIQTDLGQIIHKNQDRYRHVKIFGMIEQGFSKIMLQDEMPSFINQDYDYSQEQKKYITDYLYPLYNNQKDPNTLQQNKDIARKAWIALEENQRWANRYQVDAYITFLHTLGYGASKKLSVNQIEISPEEFNKQLNIALARSKQEQGNRRKKLIALQRMEHYRWNAERTIEGWKYGIERDNIYHIHNRIVLFKELPETEKLKDRNIIENLPYLLNIAGYKIYPLQKE